MACTRFRVCQSSLINSFLSPITPVSERPSVSDSSQPVTQRTFEYRSADGRFLLLDTVGTDKDGYESGLPRERIGDRPVHFIVLLQSRRWQNEWAQILRRLQWARPGSNVSKWAAHGAAFQPSPTPAASSDPDAAPPSTLHLRDLASLSYAQLPALQPALPPPPPTVSKALVASPGPSAAAASSRVAAPSVAASKSMQWFGVEAPRLGESERRLYDAWQHLDWSLPKQKPMSDLHWRIISTRPTVDEQRQTGERLLVFHLLLLSPEQAHNWAMNERLYERVVCQVPGLQAHIQKVYEHVAGSADLSHETYADYIEALFFSLFTDRDHRRYIVHFLRACTTDH